MLFNQLYQFRIYTLRSCLGFDKHQRSKPTSQSNQQNDNTDDDDGADNDDDDDDNDDDNNDDAGADYGAAINAHATAISDAANAAVAAVDAGDRAALCRSAVRLRTLFAGARRFRIDYEGADYAYAHDAYADPAYYAKVAIHNDDDGDQDVYYAARAATAAAAIVNHKAHLFDNDRLRTAASRLWHYRFDKDSFVRPDFFRHGYDDDWE